MHFPQARAYLQKVTSNVYASYLFILANVQNKIESKIYNPGFQKRAFEVYFKNEYIFLYTSLYSLFLAFQQQKLHGDYSQKSKIITALKLLIVNLLFFEMLSLK